MAWSGHILNASFERWDSPTAPADMNNQQTNSVISRLERDQQYSTNPGTYVIRTVMGQHGGLDGESRSLVLPGPLVYDGLSSLRSTITSAASVDDFRLWSPGAILAALTGASTQELPYEAMERHVFSLVARSDVQSNLLRLRIVLRDAADNILGYVDSNGHVQTVASTIDFGMSEVWRKHAITWLAPPAIGGTAVHHYVWQVSNGSAGEQVIDLDDLHFGPHFKFEEA